MTPKDYEIERIFTGMIANFVNYGDPSYYGYQWAEWQQEKRNYFDIGMLQRGFIRIMGGSVLRRAFENKHG